MGIDRAHGDLHGLGDFFVEIAAGRQIEQPPAAAVRGE
jgi:hypothetical protein